MSKYRLGPIFKHDFPITQRYGENPDSYPMFVVHGHEGIDYGTPNGTEILTPFDGIILRDTLLDKDYGNFLVVWDSVQHCAVWFCHLNDTPPGLGDKVTKGQVVAHSNNTGHSTGPHTHVNFVETDASGNRLNLNNGKQGFLDLLDTDLVEFVDPAIIAQSIAQEPQITPQTKLPMFDNQEQQAVRSQFDAKDRQLADYEKKTLNLIYDVEKAQKDLRDYISQQKEDVEVTTITYPVKPKIAPKTDVIFEPPLILTNLYQWFKNRWK